MRAREGCRVQQRTPTAFRTHPDINAGEGIFADYASHSDASWRAERLFLAIRLTLHFMLRGRSDRGSYPSYECRNDHFRRERTVDRRPASVFAGRAQFIAQIYEKGFVLKAGRVPSGVVAIW
jgi:hypothetical protein